MSSREEWEALNGKEIMVIRFINGDVEEPLTIVANEEHKLFMSAVNLGDRVETWVVVKTNNNEEYARYNCRAIESIYWTQP